MPARTLKGIPADFEKEDKWKTSSQSCFRTSNKER